MVQKPPPDVRIYLIGVGEGKYITLPPWGAREGADAFLRFLLPTRPHCPPTTRNTFHTLFVYHGRVLSVHGGGCGGGDQKVKTTHPPSPTPLLPSHPKVWSVALKTRKYYDLRVVLDVNLLGKKVNPLVTTLASLLPPHHVIFFAQVLEVRIVCMGFIYSGGYGVNIQEEEGRQLLKKLDCGLTLLCSYLPLFSSRRPRSCTMNGSHA
jgi:hypothetical protein